MSATVNDIKQLYPAMYEAARDLYTFDKKVQHAIDKKYGKNSFDSIKLGHEYNKEIENASLGIFSDSSLSKFAKNRLPKYNLLVDESFKVKNVIGASLTLSYIDTLQSHFS
jgi:hypothetical protein